MNRRHKKHTCKSDLPAIWLMTDPRMGEGLMRAVQKLPQGSGVIFRHYELEPCARLALFHRIAKICRRRGHKLLLAGSVKAARKWRADGVHGLAKRYGLANRGGHMIHSAPVHSAREIAAAKLCGADIMLQSPCFSTATHPGVRPLGMIRFMQLAHLCAPVTVIALGGMTQRRAMMMNKKIVHGWAGIDAFR